MQRLGSRRLARGPLLAVALCAGILGARRAEAAPSVEDVLTDAKAASGGAAWDGAAALEATYEVAAFGMTGTVHALIDLTTGRSVTRYEVGPAKGADGFDGLRLWHEDEAGLVTLTEGGDGLALAVNAAYRDRQGWWRADRGGARITCSELQEGATRYAVLSVSPPGGRPFEARFDRATKLLVEVRELKGARTETTRFSDFATFDGLVLPRVVVIDPGSGEAYRQTLRLTAARVVARPGEAAFAPPTTQVRDASIAGGAAEAVLPVRLSNNHLFGEAKVNGKGPFTFIFDTGGANLVTPELARELGLVVNGTLPHGGSGEGVMEGGLAQLDRIELGAAVVEKQTAMVLPLGKLAPVEGMAMPGMIGFETFRRFVTRIDYGRGTVTLIDPRRFDPRAAGVEIPFTFHGRTPEVMGTFEGLPAKFDLDTGSGGELTLTEPFAAKHGLRAKHPHGVDAVVGWGVGGPSLGYMTRAAAMTIGPVAVTNVVVAFATQKKGVMAGDDFQGNIGSKLLKRFVVTFDYGHQKLYLKARTDPVADTGSYDRAGLWLNRAPDGFVIVAVTHGSPAADAGLAAGDRVTAIDGQAWTAMTLAELRLRLRTAPPGTELRLDVAMGPLTRSVIVRLRDLL